VVCCPGVLQAALTIIALQSKFILREVVGPIGLEDRDLAINDVKNRSLISLGRPTPDVVFHQHAHLGFFLTMKSEQEITGAIQTY